MQLYLNPDYTLYQYFKIAVYSPGNVDVSNSSVSRKEFRVSNEVHSWGSRPWPYKFGLTSKYKYTLERARMGRCANENGSAKAFSQLDIASYRISISLADIIAVILHLGVKVLNH